MRKYLFLILIIPLICFSGYPIVDTLNIIIDADTLYISTDQIWSSVNINFINTMNMNNNAIINIDWANSDDGSGSGLDADLLDGYNEDYFLDTNYTVRSGDLGIIDTEAEFESELFTIIVPSELDYTDSVDVDGWNFFNKENELTGLLDNNYAEILGVSNDSVYHADVLDGIELVNIDWSDVSMSTGDVNINDISPANSDLDMNDSNITNINKLIVDTVDADKYLNTYNREVSCGFSSMLFGAEENMILWRYIGETNDTFNLYSGSLSDTLWNQSWDSVKVRLINLTDNDTTVLLDSIRIEGTPYSSHAIGSDTVFIEVINLFKAINKVLSVDIGGRVD